MGVKRGGGGVVGCMYLKKGGDIKKGGGWKKKGGADTPFRTMISDTSWQKKSTRDIISTVTSLRV